MIIETHAKVRETIGQLQNPEYTEQADNDVPQLLQELLAHIVVLEEAARIIFSEVVVHNVTPEELELVTYIINHRIAHLRKGIQLCRDRRVLYYRLNRRH